MRSLRRFRLQSLEFRMRLIDLALPLGNFLRTLAVGLRFSQVALGELLLRLRHLALRIAAQNGIGAVRIHLSERSFKSIDALRIAVRLCVGDLLLHRVALRIAAACLSGTHYRKDDDDAERKCVADRIQAGPPSA